MKGGNQLIAESRDLRERSRRLWVQARAKPLRDCANDDSAFVSSDVVSQVGINRAANSMRRPSGSSTYRFNSNEPFIFPRISRTYFDPDGRRAGKRVRFDDMGSTPFGGEGDTNRMRPVANGSRRTGTCARYPLCPGLTSISSSKSHHSHYFFFAIGTGIPAMFTLTEPKASRVVK